MPDRAKRNAYMSRYQREHRVKARACANARFKRRQQALEELKAAPCVDCGNDFPSICMDFDHRDPVAKDWRLKWRNGKQRGMSYAAQRFSEEAFLAEVAKCDLVCANCHRIRTRKSVMAARAAIAA